MATISTESRCWVCGSARTRNYRSANPDRALKPADVAITDSRYGLTLTLLQCDDCGFIFAAGDELAHLKNLYEQLEDSAYERTQDSRRCQMQWLLSRVVRLRPRAKTLLDIGAGTGLLVHEARARGLEAVGIEPSRSLVRSARRIHDVELLEGYFPHPAIADRTFDIITMIDVIEHVTEPVTLLRDAARALVSDGMLLVTTPDVGSLAARFLKHRWWHFRLAHVGYFNRVTLLRAADRADLQAVQMWRPKWFFRIGYVAMRLEHYLPIGLINRAARKLPAGRWLYRRVVPINPHDSLAVFLQRRT